MDIFSTKGINHKIEAYELVQTLERSEEIAKTILEAASYSHVVLGVDCEGILRGRPLCLIQIFYRDCTYVFDLLEVNPFAGMLREVLESETIVKVFHDFAEDAASLITHYGVKCENVFDTQIAHRMLANSLNPNKCNENNSISLNKLLMTYLEIEHDLKDYISGKIQADITLWEKRPLTDEMINYATQDVYFLPRIYEIFCHKAMMFYSSLNFDLISSVFSESRKCNIYAYINISCKSIMFLKVGQYLTAFMKNYQRFCIYCSLNLGCTGVVLDQQSIKFIKTYFQMGDMLNLEVVRKDIDEKKVILKVPEYYLNMDAEMIANYCFYAKSQTEKTLSRSSLNIYETPGKQEIKTKLKNTSRSFFGKQATRERTYSGNEALTMPSLETNQKAYLKNCESTDDLQKIREEAKGRSKLSEVPEAPVVAPKRKNSDFTGTKRSGIKKFLEKQPQENVAREVFKGKKDSKKNKRNKRRGRKVKDFHNWTYVQ